MCKPKRWYLGIPVVALLTTAGPLSSRADTAEGSFEQTLKVTGPVELEVTSPYGKINVRPGAADVVRVFAEIRAKSKWHERYSAKEKVKMLEQNPPVEQDGNGIRIGEIDDEDLRKNVRINYRLEVPAETRLDARTGYGDVVIEGVNRSVNARTGYGDVEVSRPRSEVVVTTGYGDIRVEGEPSGDWELRTGYGHLRLRLPADASFDLNFRSGYGKVHSEHPVTLRGSFSGSDVRGQVRGGGPLIEARTGYGNIYLE